MATFRGMQFWELTNNPRSPRVSRAVDRSSATREILVDWYNVERFAIEAVGYSWLGTNSSSLPAIQRAIPWSFPAGSLFVHGDQAEVDSMFCEKFDYEGYGVYQSSTTQYDGSEDGDETVYVNKWRKKARYEKARCTLSYSTPTYDIFSDAYLGGAYADESAWKRYVTKQVRPQGEFINITGSTNSAYFVARVTTNGADPMPVAQSLNKIIAACNYSVTWHQIPQTAIPMEEFNPKSATSSSTNPNNAINKCLGRVNDRTYNGFPQGTLLLLAVEIKPMKDVVGKRIYDVTYMFKHFAPGEPYTLSRPGFDPLVVTPGHNHVFIPATRLTGTTFFIDGTTPSPGWYEVVGTRGYALSQPYSNFADKTPSVNIYDFANFANLFRPVTWAQA